MFLLVYVGHLMSHYPSHYDRLSVARSAPDAIIRAAYKALIQHYHPDKFQGSEQEALHLTKLVREAYETLIDPAKRAEYDRLLDEQEAKANQENSPPPINTNSSTTDSTEIYLTANYWMRFFARIFDLWWEMPIFGTLLSIFFSSFSDNFSQLYEHTYASIFLSIIFLPVILILDALIYHVFGNTPGKKLLGLKVNKLNGESLSLTEYINRNYLLWKSGLAFGVPILNFFTMQIQANRIKNGLEASYDEEKGFRVLAQPIGFIKKTSFVFLFILLFFIQSLIDSVDRINRHSQKPFNIESSYQENGNLHSESDSLKTPYSKSSTVMWRNIEFNNECSEPISLAITYWDGSEWVVTAWWNAEPHSQIDTGLQTTLKEIYIYGVSANYSWKGEEEKDISWAIIKDSFTSSQSKPLLDEKAVATPFYLVIMNENTLAKNPYFEFKLECPIKKAIENDKKDKFNKSSYPDYEKIISEYPDYEKIIANKKFIDWLRSRNSESRSRFERIINGGTSAEVIAMIKAYNNDQKQICILKVPMLEEDYERCGIKPRKNKKIFNTLICFPVGSLNSHCSLSISLGDSSISNRLYPHRLSDSRRSR